MYSILLGAGYWRVGLIWLLPTLDADGKAADGDEVALWTTIREYLQIGRVQVMNLPSWYCRSTPD